jgi:glycerol-3-phosphate acyltransferase PlsY
VLELSIKSLLAYLVGALIGSLLVGRVRGVDIRTLGSGNAGGTNALRTQGPAFAAAVIAIDFGKALLAVGVLPKLVLPMVGIAPAVDREWLAVACAVAVVVGHVYPVWYEFRGGKGAATLIGAVAVLSPVALLPVLGVWLVCVMLTGYVGLSTMLGALTLPVWYAVMRPESTALVSFGVVMALFVAFTHRSNIQRMIAGTEPRIGADKTPGVGA